MSRWSTAGQSSGWLAGLEFNSKTVIEGVSPALLCAEQYVLVAFLAFC